MIDEVGGRLDFFIFRTVEQSLRRFEKVDLTKKMMKMASLSHAPSPSHYRSLPGDEGVVFDPSIGICVRWSPSIEGFSKFISKFREVTGSSLGGSRKSRYSYTDPTITKVLSVGPEDNPSSLPQRVSLSNFKLGPPITSYGCIYRCCSEGTAYYLLIKRKESLSYVDLIHGNYRESQLYFMLQELSMEERDRLLNEEFSRLWTDLHLKPAEGDGYEYGRETFLRILPYLRDLFAEVPPADLQGRNLWLFPKGRVNWKEVDIILIPESPIECALREFNEETNGLDLTTMKADLLFPGPVIERSLGSNSKNYQTDYFVYQTEGPLPQIKQFDRVDTGIRMVSTGEVEQISWVPFDELEAYLRPERLQLIKFIEENLPQVPARVVADHWTSPADITDFNLETA